jgi:hypothetical protein
MRPVAFRPRLAAGLALSHLLRTVEVYYRNLPKLSTIFLMKYNLFKINSKIDCYQKRRWAHRPGNADYALFDSTLVIDEAVYEREG